ncbi:hypothetical protein AB0I04_49685, partial [Actinoallomurus sp. NPDC050550]
SVPAAIVIQFLGGIHEIYFPYVLMKPRLILATVAGGAAGIGTFMITGAGLVSVASPGSILAYAAETPKGGWSGVFAGVFIAAAVSFVVGSILLGFGRFAGIGSTAACHTRMTSGPSAASSAARSAARPVSVIKTLTSARAANRAT